MNTALSDEVSHLSEMIAALSDGMSTSPYGIVTSSEDMPASREIGHAPTAGTMSRDGENRHSATYRIAPALIRATSCHNNVDRV